MRRCISLIIEKDPQLFIIGIARNGIEAIEKVQRLKPDIVTMDVEMPEMDGMTALKEIMRVCPVPVIVLSNQTDKDPETTFQALELELRILFEECAAGRKRETGNNKRVFG